MAIIIKSKKSLKLQEKKIYILYDPINKFTSTARGVNF